jgi:adenylyltransferase/sulfurtransferase
MEADDKDRYSRQIRFAGIGEQGQGKIGRSTVLIVGCGALGSFQAEALARAGVGCLRIVDRDYVEFSNLQRQFLFSETDAENELPKAIAAANRLRQINRRVRVEPAVADFTPSNAEDLACGADLILDGTDNFETRYLINDVAVKRAILWIYGAAIGATGLVLPVEPGKSPCLACIYPQPPAGAQPTCDVDGVLAPATASVAAFQTALAMKTMVSGLGPSDFKIHTFDLWRGNTTRVAAGAPDPECPVCAKHDFRYLEGKRRVPVSLCGRNAVQLHDHSRPLDLQALASRLNKVGNVRVNEFALRLALPKYDLTVFPDGRAIVKGTTDVGIARSVYAQVIGN